MRTITLSHYTREGTRRHQVFENAMVAGAETEDDVFAASLARAIYHKLPGPARLLVYDGDSDIETIVEEKP
jgi:hypothetical protein